MENYEYKFLKEEKEELDRDLLNDYLHARAELAMIKQRKKLLQAFVDKNHDKLDKYLWTNQLGQTVCILDIDDKYLVNLTKFLARSPRWNYDEDVQDKLDVLKSELEKRNLMINGSDLLELR